MIANRVIQQAGDVRELDGQMSALSSQLETVITNHAELDYKLSFKENVNSILKYMLNGAQNATVGKYEALLSNLCQDILGKDISIKLKVGEARGKPTLDIMAVNQGHCEDIIEGKGGSVANIVSVGLRYIVLARMTSLRQFIVLDEADCWISPKIIHRFADIVNQMSNDMGIQTIIVSHHEQGMFKDMNIIPLEMNDAFKRVEVEGLNEFEWESGQKGIRSVTMKNFMTHVHTTIPLSPTTNVIVGENDIGKSGIVRAIRAVSWNSGSEDMIRHGEDECSVSLTLEDGLVVTWVRKRKGAHKTAYYLHNKNGEQLRHSNEGRGLPEWAIPLIGIEPIQKFDVHFGHQKKPIFLLDRTESERAEILSVGKDTQYIHSAYSNYGKQCNKDSTEFRKLSSKLKVLSGIYSRSESLVNELHQGFKFIEAKASEHQSTSIKFSQIESVTRSMSESALHIDGVNTIQSVSATSAQLHLRVDQMIGMVIPKLASHRSELSEIKKVNLINFKNSVPRIMIFQYKLNIKPCMAVQSVDQPLIKKSLQSMRLSNAINQVDHCLINQVSIKDKVINVGPVIRSRRASVMIGRFTEHAYLKGINVNTGLKISLTPILTSTRIRKLNGSINTIQCSIDQQTNSIKKLSIDTDALAIKHGLCILCGQSVDHK